LSTKRLSVDLSHFRNCFANMPMACNMSSMVALVALTGCAVLLQGCGGDGGGGGTPVLLDCIDFKKENVGRDNGCTTCMAKAGNVVVSGRLTCLVQGFQPTFDSYSVDERLFRNGLLRSSTSNTLPFSSATKCSDEAMNAIEKADAESPRPLWCRLPKATDDHKHIEKSTSENHTVSVLKEAVVV